MVQLITLGVEIPARNSNTVIYQYPSPNRPYIKRTIVSVLHLY